MKTTIATAIGLALALVATQAHATRHYGGGSHSGSHGGHYSGSGGSSHRGGHYSYHGDRHYGSHRH